jgi:hypothetical protein
MAAAEEMAQGTSGAQYEMFAASTKVQIPVDACHLK